MNDQAQSSESPATTLTVQEGSFSPTGQQPQANGSDHQQSCTTACVGEAQGTKEHEAIGATALAATPQHSHFSPERLAKLELRKKRNRERMAAKRRIEKERKNRLNGCAAAKATRRCNEGTGDPWSFATDGGLSIQHIYDTVAEHGTETLKSVFKERGAGWKASQICKLVREIDASLARGTNLNMLLPALEQIRGTSSIYPLCSSIGDACREVEKKILNDGAATNQKAPPNQTNNAAEESVDPAPADSSAKEEDPWRFFDDASLPIQTVYETVSMHGTNAMKAVFQKRKNLRAAHRIAHLIAGIDSSRVRGFGLISLIPALEQVRGSRGLYTLADDIEAACEMAEKLISPTHSAPGVAVNATSGEHDEDKKRPPKEDSKEENVVAKGPPTPSITPRMLRKRPADTNFEGVGPKAPPVRVSADPSQQRPHRPQQEPEFAPKVFGLTCDSMQQDV